MELLADFTRRFEGGPEIHGELSLPLEGAPLTVLFGPSGCGKSTILRAIAGLERPQTGHIRTNGETWFDAGTNRFIPAHRRRVGFLAQRPNLFPHLSVAANIGFGVKTDRTRRVTELLELVGLADLAHRRPGELSGGQQQRAALARALAPKPRLLLLDEPFAALDRAAQLELRARLRDTLAASRTPALLVTHAREEALALGDHLLLMGDGRILQRGRPEEVFSHPAAASLVEEGTIVKVRILDRAHGLVRVAAGAAEMWAPDPGAISLPKGASTYAVIRPEGVILESSRQEGSSARNQLSARIVALEFKGSLVRIKLDVGFPLDALVSAWACEDLRLESNKQTHCHIKTAAIKILPT